MEGNRTGYSLVCYSICLLLTVTAIFSQNTSVSPGPVVYVKDGSNLTLLCITNLEWNIITFHDFGIRSDGIIVVMFQAFITHCNYSYIETAFGANRYSALPCNKGQPVGIIIHNITTSYHNKTIGCQVEAATPVFKTVVKIRELLTTVKLDTENNLTIQEGLILEFTCTAKSIPKASIEWYLGGSRLTEVVTTSSPSENEIISTITFRVKKVDNKKELYCIANDSFTALSSTSKTLDILYAPTVHVEPAANPYIVYEGQGNVIMTCRVGDANPINEITYLWVNPAGMVNNERVTITTISKEDDGVYSCTATNAVGQSNITTKRLDVQYEPVITVPPEKNVTAGNELAVIPTINANPMYMEVWWTRLNDTSFKLFSPTLIISNILKEDTDNYTCHVTNILTPSELSTMNKTTEKTVFVNVQYIPTIHMDPLYYPYVLVSGQENVTLTCIVEDANPLNDITYHWTSPRGNTRGQTYTIKSVSMNDTGQYRCLAENSIGNSSVNTKQIDVHYGPVITVIPIQNVTAGTELSVLPSIKANPRPTVVWWTRIKDINFKQDGPELIISNIQKEHTDNYTCHVMNTLMPSGEVMKNKTAEKNLYVNVQYVPVLKMNPKYNPYILFSGQKNVTLTCIVEDANPLNGIQYQWTHPAGNAEGQTFSIETVSKQASGQYRCLARNVIGNSSVYTKEIDVHYSSFISNISTQRDIVEGNDLILYPVLDSNPVASLVWWTRQNDTNFKYNNSVFMIESIQRKFSDNYTLHVMNTLKPSGQAERKITSKWIIYVNVQYPPYTVIAEAPNHQILENETLTLHCSVSDANPSITSISWYQNETLVLSNKGTYTIKGIQRTAAGSYICNARNKIGNDTTSVNISVLYGPDVRNLMVLNGSIVPENATTVLECEIDSNPVSRLEWSFNNELMSDYHFDGRYSFYYIKKTTCYHTGKYHCSATNKIFTHMFNASKDVQLYVNCYPRLNMYIEQPQSKIGLPLGGILQLNVHIVAFPELTKAEWTFRPNITNNTRNIDEGEFQSDVFRHIVNLYKPNITENDFGDYILEVKNVIGSNIYTFHVVPEGPPEPSVIINATCGIRSAVVYWLTSFSGGDAQIFSVIVANDNRKDTFETNVLSNEKGEMKSTSLHLSPGEYTFTIIGQNKYDSTISANRKSCHVKDTSKTKNSSVVAAATGGGIGTAVIIIGTVALILFIVKKRRMLKGKQPEDGRKNLTDEDKDEDDGLKDNPLYGTSHGRNDDSGPMYSQVNKSSKMEEHNEDVKDEGPVYSQVQTKKTKGKPVKDGRKTKKEKGKSQKDMEMGSVYENSEKVITDKQIEEIYANTGRDTPTKQQKDGYSYQLKKNKDGLIYADLDIAPSGNRFVIRGLENRNNYAIIDLTKTAEPLPSDEEEGEEHNDNENTTAN